MRTPTFYRKETFLRHFALNDYQSHLFSRATQSANARVPATGPPDFNGFVEQGGAVSMETEHFASSAGINGARWEVIPGMGRTGDSVAVFTTTMPSVEAARLSTHAPRLD
jgi:hypothetical protein